MQPSEVSKRDSFSIFAASEVQFERTFCSFPLLREMDFFFWNKIVGNFHTFWTWSTCTCMCLITIVNSVVMIVASTVTIVQQIGHNCRLLSRCETEQMMKINPAYSSLPQPCFFFICRCKYLGAWNVDEHPLKVHLTGWMLSAFFGHILICSWQSPLLLYTFSQKEHLYWSPWGECFLRVCAFLPVWWWMLCHPPSVHTAPPGRQTGSLSSPWHLCLLSVCTLWGAASNPSCLWRFCRIAGTYNHDHRSSYNHAHNLYNCDQVPHNRDHLLELRLALVPMGIVLSEMVHRVKFLETNWAQGFATLELRNVHLCL